MKLYTHINITIPIGANKKSTKKNEPTTKAIRITPTTVYINAKNNSTIFPPLSYLNYTTYK